MNSQDLCEHTYLRWDNRFATTPLAACAVCGKEFPAMEYDAKFVGTFPREVYRKQKLREWEEAHAPVYKTLTLNMPEHWRLYDNL